MVYEVGGKVCASKVRSGSFRADKQNVVSIVSRRVV
jgi:hypothetical protein